MSDSEDSPKPVRRFGAGAFSISLLVHLLFVLLAIFYFVKWVEPPQEKLDFLPGGGGGGGNEGQKATRIKAQKSMATSTALSKRIAVAGPSSFSLPDAAEFGEAAMPMSMTDASSGSGGGAGGGRGTGLGTGTGPGSGPGVGPGIGKGFVSTTPFGSKETRYDALAGHLYDFKQTSRGKEVEGYDTGNVEHFTSRVLQIQEKRFRDSAVRDYFKAPDTLYLTQLVIPNRPAQEGPALFGAGDKMKPAGWFAIYNGRLKAPKDMTFRFVGSADDYIGIQIKSKIRLIAARPEIQKTVQDRWEPAKTDQEFPGPMGTLVFGDWIQVKKGEEMEMALSIGERPGGYVGFLLLVEEKGKNYKKTASGRPILPVFTTEPITDPIRDRISKGLRDWEFDWEDVPVFTNDSGKDPFAEPFK